MFALSATPSAPLLSSPFHPSPCALHARSYCMYRNTLNRVSNLRRMAFLSFLRGPFSPCALARRRPDAAVRGRLPGRRGDAGNANDCGARRKKRWPPTLKQTIKFRKCVTRLDATAGRLDLRASRATRTEVVRRLVRPSAAARARARARAPAELPVGALSHSNSSLVRCRPGCRAQTICRSHRVALCHPRRPPSRHAARGGRGGFGRRAAGRAAGPLGPAKRGRHQTARCSGEKAVQKIRLNGRYAARAEHRGRMPAKATRRRRRKQPTRAPRQRRRAAGGVAFRIRCCGGVQKADSLQRAPARLSWNCALATHRIASPILVSVFPFVSQTTFPRRSRDATRSPLWRKQRTARCDGKEASWVGEFKLMGA